MTLYGNDANVGVTGLTLLKEFPPSEPFTTLLATLEDV